MNTGVFHLHRWVGESRSEAVHVVYNFSMLRDTCELGREDKFTHRKRCDKPYCMTRKLQHGKVVAGLNAYPLSMANIVILESQSMHMCP